MATQAWQAGKLYNPGALVRPLTAPPTAQSAPTNPEFEAGDSGWGTHTGMSIGAFGAGTAFTGTFSLRQSVSNPDPRTAINTNVVPVTPGHPINASCQIQQGSSSPGQAGGGLLINWYDAGMTLISQDLSGAGSGLVDSGSAGEWRTASLFATAPPTAAFAVLGVFTFLLGGGSPVYADMVSWDYVFSAPPTGLIFKAVQANAGYSGSAEPIWPTVLAGTVVDNQVTWEAVLTSRVTWKAFPILKSGATEPVFPTSDGSTVADNTIIWEATSGRITDPKCPQSKTVLIAASKVFAGDEDIIRYSATVNPLDWSTINDAGYLPFGLQKLGTNPVAALDLYRSNLVAFNANGFQMWQIDQDPASNAFLDAVPVPSVFHRASQPLANDLITLTPVGVRDIGIAAASTNLQAGGVGEQIDRLITAEIRLAATGGYDPISLLWPATGQYWIMFQERVYVLTINSGKKRSWSRYTFPAAITDWTLNGTQLYLRAGQLVWLLDADVLYDDQYEISFRITEDGDFRITETGDFRVAETIMAVGEEGDSPSISRVGFTGTVQWAYLDLGRLGQQKNLVGFDLVCDAPFGVLVSVGYDERNQAARTTPYLVDADTLPGQLVPLPVSAPSMDLQLTFPAGQAWEWSAATLYVMDNRIGA